MVLALTRSNSQGVVMSSSHLCVSVFLRQRGSQQRSGSLEGGGFVSEFCLCLFKHILFSISSCSLQRGCWDCEAEHCFLMGSSDFNPLRNHLLCLHVQKQRTTYIYICATYIHLYSSVSSYISQIGNGSLHGACTIITKTLMGQNIGPIQPFHKLQTQTSSCFRQRRKKNLIQLVNKKTILHAQLMYDVLCRIENEPE